MPAHPLDRVDDNQAVAIVDPEGVALSRCTVEHSSAGLRSLIKTLRKADVEAVGIERLGGPVVDALLEAGFIVFVIAPNQVKNLRSPCASGSAYRIGLYGPERSIIDAFRLRHNEGTDLAHEALKRWLRRRDSSPAWLIRMAENFPKAQPALRAALEVLLTRPSRDNRQGSVDLDLQQQAKRDARPFAELLTLYTLEGFLARLAKSRHASRLVLKGGLLLAAYDARRPTRDADFAGRQIQLPALPRADLPQVDVNVGDPITPAPQPVRVPRLLDATASIDLVGYPLQWCTPRRT